MLAIAGVPAGERHACAGWCLSHDGWTPSRRGGSHPEDGVDGRTGFDQTSCVTEGANPSRTRWDAGYGILADDQQTGPGIRGRNARMILALFASGDVCEPYPVADEPIIFGHTQQRTGRHCTAQGSVAQRSVESRLQSFDTASEGGVRGEAASVPA